MGAPLLDLPIEIFGGRNTSMPPADLPAGASPLNQDVVFPEGAVRSRPPLVNYFGLNGPVSNASVQGMKTYETSQTGIFGVTPQLVVVDNQGNIYLELIQGTLSKLATFANNVGTSMSYRSITLFGREYIALGSLGANGNEFPRQLTSTGGPQILANIQFDRVSQYGPGGGLTAADSAGAGNVSAGVHGFTVAFITRQGYITKPAPPITWTAAGAHQATVTYPTGPANIVGRILLFTVVGGSAASSAYFSILSTMQINDNTTTTSTVDFTDANLTAGFSGAFLFTQIELGECAFAGSYNARTVWMGELNKVQNFVNIEFDGGWNIGGGTGGSDVPLGWISDATNGAGASRGVGSSPGAGQWMDYLQITGDGASALRGMVRQSAFQDNLGNQILAPNTLYSFRCRAVKNGATQGNLVIDVIILGGATIGSAIIPVSTIAAGPQWTLIQGTLITNPPATMSGIAVLRVYTSGTVNNNASIGVDGIEIYPTANPINTSTVTMSHAQQPESFDGVTSRIIIRPNDGQVCRAGFQIRNNYYIGKDHYLGYVTDDGVNEPASWQVNDVAENIGICGPDAVDSSATSSGAVDDGIALFAHRSGVYVCDGSAVTKISQEIQEDASGTGQISWNSINWQAATTIWCRIDQTNKRFLVGAPINGAVSPNVIFVMDYKFVTKIDYTTQGPGAVYSTFTGRLLTHGGARKWTIWNITAPTATFAERASGNTQLFIGNGAGNGKIYTCIDPLSGLYPTNGTYSDDGTPINSFYQSYAVPDPQQEMQMQMKAHRKLINYLTGLVRGSGVLPGVATSITRSGGGYVTVVMSQAHGLAVGNWVILSGWTGTDGKDNSFNGYFQVVATTSFNFTFFAPGPAPSATGGTQAATLNLSVISPYRTTTLRGVGLSTTPAGDFERQVNVHGERNIFQVGTSAAGAWFQLEKLIPSGIPDPTILVRGAGY